MLLLLLLLSLFVSQGIISALRKAMGRTGRLTFTMGRLLYQLGWWISGAILRVSNIPYILRCYMLFLGNLFQQGLLPFFFSHLQICVTSLVISTNLVFKCLHCLDVVFAKIESNTCNAARNIQTRSLVGNKTPVHGFSSELKPRATSILEPRRRCSAGTTYEPTTTPSISKKKNSRHHREHAVRLSGA
jgi:hypothetical protein